MTIDAEILGLVRHKHEVHDALTQLFRSCAPHCTPDEDTLGLVYQLSNVIAGYRQSLDAINSKALVYAEQVGDGPLVGNVRYGFYTLAHMAPAWSVAPQTAPSEKPEGDNDDILAARAADAVSRLASLGERKDMNHWEDESGSRVNRP